MSDEVILFGAGSGGLETLASMREKGIFPVCFADNDVRKHGEMVAGVKVLHPKDAQITYPKATWVVSIYKAEARDVRDQLREMDVKMEPLGTHLPFCQRISNSAWKSLDHVAHDHETSFELTQQVRFRGTMDYDRQSKPSPMSELYFPPFIQKIENEVFVDCGACDGDSIEAFLNWAPKFEHIYAFEPDPENIRRMSVRMSGIKDVRLMQVSGWPYAVSDTNGREQFTALGHYGSQLSKSGETTVHAVRMDSMGFSHAPTFIKMDIEGSELRALWGARRMLKDKMPVLAICAYHQPDHLWEIPLLIHAIHPDYNLLLRRYAEGTRELVWYAVPDSRLKSGRE